MEHKLTSNAPENDDGWTLDVMDYSWECTCGMDFGSLDIEAAFQHGQEAGSDFGSVIPAARESLGSTMVGAVIDRWADYREVGDERAMKLIAHLASPKGSDQMNALLERTYEWVADLESICDL